VKRSRIAVLAAVVLGLCATVPDSRAATPAFDFVAIRDVTIVDVRRGELNLHQSVVWQDSRIIAAGPTANIPIPPDAHIVDGRGRYLTPGFWDMHVHVLHADLGLDQAADELILPLFIAYGVTGVRNMGDVVVG
jgi:predicted amidohydrolase